MVNDIRNFYPSVSRDQVCNGLNKHLEINTKDNDAKVVAEACKQILNVSHTGLPIGPAISHVFGNVALERVDGELYKLYNERYMRYVDDIFIVTAPEEANTAKENLERLVESEGLLLHDGDGKQDVISSKVWLENMPTADEELCGNDFDALFTRIRLLLWHRPEAFKTFRRLFKHYGIPIPLARLAIDAQYGRFQAFMRRYVISSRGRLPDFFKQYMFDNEKNIIKDVVKLRFSISRRSLEDKHRE